MPAATSRTWRRPVLLLVAALLVAAAAVAVVVLQRSPAPGAAADAASDERPGPVLLVPGYGGGSLQALADRLRAEGRDVTVVDLPGDGTGDLTESAAALEEAADAALDRTGEESVDLVGYSAGGLIARLWVAGDGDDVVRRVVTLGSPHHGTTMADFAASFAPSRCPVGCSQTATCWPSSTPTTRRPTAWSGCRSGASRTRSSPRRNRPGWTAR